MARILVVDDHPLNRDLLKTILGYANHEVVEASDGAEALDLVRTQPFDLIISDILMPTMDGIGFVQAIRAEPRFDHINVVFYTATYRLLDARKMADSCGVLKVLPKPCEPEVIIATVNECLGITTVPQSPPPTQDLRSAPCDKNLVTYLKDLHQLNARITTIVAQGAELIGRGGLIEKATGALNLRLMEDLQSQIGERRTLEGALLKTATQLQNVFNNVDVVIWSYDLKGSQMLEFSPACESIYGLPPQAFFEQPRLMFEAVHPEDQPLAARQMEDLRKGLPTLIEHRIIRPDGSLRWVLAKANPQKDSSGQVIRIDGAVSDITESRRAKERMVQQDRLAALGSLVGTVAHDIRNPLMVMTAAAELLEAEIPDNDRCRSHLDRLGRANLRIMTLVDDLLDFGRPKALHLASTPEQALLGEAVEACATAAAKGRVRVERQVGGNPRELILDPDRMHQVLRNILENAIQHSPPEGVVRIASWFETGSWMCTLADEGSGIAGEDLPRVFDPFFSKRPGGTGLGLAIAHRIVLQHGGELTVENRSTGGAVFTIKLPLIA